MANLKVLTVLSLVLIINPVCSNILDDIVNTVTGFFSSSPSQPPSPNSYTENPERSNMNPNAPQLSEFEQIQQMIVNSICNPSYIPPQLTGNPEIPSFEEYLKIFGINFNEKEYSQRCLAYYQNIVRMIQVAQNRTNEFSVNSLMVLFPEELQRTLGLINEPRTTTESEEDIQIKAGLPSSFDWRQYDNIVTPVKQGGTCGSVGFAVVSYIQSYFMKHYQYRYLEPVDLAEQYLINCGSDSCSGAYPEDIFQDAINGIPLEIDYPYQENQRKDDQCQFYEKEEFVENMRVISHYNLNDKEIISLLQDGPVFASVGSQDWISYKSGVFSCSERQTVDHPVLIVGYTPDYWIIKNSWGKQWGEDGFIRVSRNPSNNCKIGAVIIYLKPSYENKQPSILDEISSQINSAIGFLSNLF